jgi:hypothetical protein
MAKPNYQHARRQKEMARKARQQDKQQRRTRDTPAPGDAPPGSAGTPVTPVAGSGTTLKAG